jgi:hypothetical protein
MGAYKTNKKFYVLLYVGACLATHLHPQICNRILSLTIHKHFSDTLRHIEGTLLYVISYISMMQECNA